MAGGAQTRISQTTPTTDGAVHELRIAHGIMDYGRSKERASPKTKEAHHMVPHCEQRATAYCFSCVAFRLMP